MAGLAVCCHDNGNAADDKGVGTNLKENKTRSNGLSHFTRRAASSRPVLHESELRVYIELQVYL